MLSSLVVLGGLVALPMVAAQFTIDPPTTAPDDTIRDCTNWWVALDGDTCELIAESNFISLEQLYAYNPSLEDGCDIVVNTSYCIEQNFGVPPPTTTQPPPTTTTGNGISTPTPTQTGMVGNCNKFHLVVSGDQCGDIASDNDISLANFYAWNPAVGSDCRTLIIGYHVCVGIVGGVPPPTTTSGGNGISTPTPTQTGMVGNCNEFHLVVSGDSCPDIASDNSISLADFYSWNPAVGSDCRTLIVGYHVCVGIVGGTPTTTTTTSTGNGISTPTPTQTGMVGNCNKFHLVVSGDSCPDIASDNSISLANLYSWNPAVGSDCRTLIVGFHVCVGIVGGTPTTTTTTSTGNGISTPTPTQTGMVGNCNRFHRVVSGDGCQAIATRYSITLANLYAWNPAVGSDCRTLIIDYHVCVGIIGGSPPPTTTTTTTRPGNGVATPTPIQTGMTGNCNGFYLVRSGDGCFDIAAAAGIALNDFYSWNPAVRSDCSGLQPNFYVCTRLIGTPTTTTRGNGVATPTPTQTGMVTNCDTFHRVVSGDECAVIASRAGITLANFYRWNPAVGSTCSTLVLGYYVCIGLI
jgi:LysM repeat protein